LRVAPRRRIQLPADLAIVVGATFQRDPADRLLGADDARELVAKAEEFVLARR
jgi:hypothetical protein